jgi:hypothetical protein
VFKDFSRYPVASFERTIADDRGMSNPVQKDFILSGGSGCLYKAVGVFINNRGDRFV